VVKRAFRILRATFGVVANTDKLIPEQFFSVNYESLLTDFHNVVPIEYRNKGLDFYVSLIDRPNDAFGISVSDGKIRLTGSILGATQKASDLRYSLFGNEGLIFRQILAMLEKKYGIYSLHACSLYDEKTNHFYIVAGGAGSGKTCLLLRGIELGLRLFSTELTHFSVGDGVTFYKGALVDNIRVGNLKYSYPFLPERLKLKLPDTEDEWGKKIPVDLRSVQVSSDTIEDPKTTVILPHIEHERSKNVTIHVKDTRTLQKALFDNISEKISENVVLYDSIPLGGLDTLGLIRKRYHAVDGFVQGVDQAVRVIAGVGNCWQRLLE
jgi:hypothetical protein